MVIICSVALCNGTCEWLCDSVGHQIVMLNVYYKNVCSEAPFSQTTRLNCLKLSQIGYIYGYEFLEFFQFFLETLNFWPKFETEPSNRFFSQTTHPN